jgi:lipoprotein-anchoring transpeptidase ErfK/SrfK
VPNHANTQFTFSDNLTSDFSTGDARVVTVSNATHTLTVTDDGKVWGTFPVSLGANNTPTKRGVKVIMEQVKTVCMHDVNNTYYECGIKWDSRLTYDGEYLHAAPWNVYNITHGINSSNGCTNLLPKDATKLYNFLEIGDVVKYPNADGPLMRLGDGYGDWNVPWAQWLGGGLYKTTD